VTGIEITGAIGDIRPDTSTDDWLGPGLVAGAMSGSMKISAPPYPSSVTWGVLSSEIVIGVELEIVGLVVFDDLQHVAPQQRDGGVRSDGRACRRLRIR
jgi:hypothetical protein